jgi:hypothetical protein
MTTATYGAHSRQHVSRWAPAKHGFAVWRRKAAIKARAASVHIVGTQATARRLIMTAAALGFLDAAAYDYRTIAGLAATGVSLLVFNECMN